MKSSVALVTGAHGAIGRHVAAKLSSRGWRVAGIGHGRWQVEEYSRWGLSSWQEADVSLPALRALDLRPDLVVHCAGSGAVGASLSAPYADFERTVGTTAAVLEFLRSDRSQASLVLPSSAAVYGIAEHLPVAEDAPLRPVSPYGVHKKIAEELVQSHASAFSLKAAVVRLFSVYGEGFRKQLLWDACRKVARGQTEAFFGTGDETRDWLHVSDAAELLVMAADYAQADCPVVNGGYGTRTAVREILLEVLRLMGRRERPSFCGTQRPGDPQHYHADIRRAVAWGWQPQLDWRAGVARYVSWFQSVDAIA